MVCPMTSDDEHAMMRAGPDTVGDRTRDRSDPDGRMFVAGEDTVAERIPSWFLRSAGGMTALIVLWFGMAFMGGLPGGAVEWLALAILGAFAYSLGVTIPLLVTLALRRAGRF